MWHELSQVKLRPHSGKRANDIARQVELLSDDDIDRRRAAASVLKEFGWAALPALAPLVESGDLDLRTEARKAVWEILGK